MNQPKRKIDFSPSSKFRKNIIGIILLIPVIFIVFSFTSAFLTNQKLKEQKELNLIAQVSALKNKNESLIADRENAYIPISAENQKDVFTNSSPISLVSNEISEKDLVNDDMLESNITEFICMNRDFNPDDFDYRYQDGNSYSISEKSNPFVGGILGTRQEIKINDKITLLKYHFELTWAKDNLYNFQALI